MRFHVVGTFLCRCKLLHVSVFWQPFILLHTRLIIRLMICFIGNMFIKNVCNHLSYWKPKFSGENALLIWPFHRIISLKVRARLSNNCTHCCVLQYKPGRHATLILKTFVYGIGCPEGQIHFA